jgi:hypothetical protein
VPPFLETLRVCGDYPQAAGKVGPADYKIDPHP